MHERRAPSAESLERLVEPPIDDERTPLGIDERELVVRGCRSQPAVSQPDRSRDPAGLAVGAAMRQRLGHPAQQPRVGRATVGMEDAGDAAHDVATATARIGV